MTDKEKLEAIRAEIEKLRDFATNEQMDLYEKGTVATCEVLLHFIDSFTKEPVSEELEIAAEKYRKELHDSESDVDDEGYMYECVPSDAFKAGAQWQKEQSKLTWLDMMHIHKHIKDAMNLHLYKFQSLDGQQEVYQNVLDRFIKERDNH